MTTDGTGDDRITPEGAPLPHTFMGVEDDDNPDDGDKEDDGSPDQADKRPEVTLTGSRRTAVLPGMKATVRLC